jgi:hypothetical protein
VGVGAINVEGSIGLYVGCSIEHGRESVQTSYGGQSMQADIRRRGHGLSLLKHVPKLVDVLFGQARRAWSNVSVNSQRRVHGPAQIITRLTYTVAVCMASSQSVLTTLILSIN